MSNKAKYVIVVALFALSYPFSPALAAQHALGSNIITPEGTVYTITQENNQTVRRPYTSAGAFLSYSFNTWDSITGSTAEDLALPVGSFIPPQDGKIICSDRGTDRGTCYLITNGQKAGFTSASVFKGLGYSFNYVMSGDVSFLQSTGNIDSSVILHQPGTLINKGGTVYVVGNGGLLGVPDWATLKSWGYTAADIVTANSADWNLPNAGTLSYRQPQQLAVLNNSGSSGTLNTTQPGKGISFSASLSSSGSPIYITNGTTGQRIASFNLSVGNSASAITLNSVGVQTASNNVAGNFQNLKVYVNGSLYGSAIQNPANSTSYTFYSRSGAVTLSTSQFIPLEVYADVVGNATINQPIVTLDSSRTYVQTGDYNLTGSVTTNLAASVTGQTIVQTPTGNIQISIINLPSGTVGQPYSGSIKWSAPNISPTTDITAVLDRVGTNNYPYPYLPDGLTFSPNCLAGAPGSSCVFSGLRNNSGGQGQISVGGTPTQAGTYTFTVTLREGQYNSSDTKTVTVVISPATTPGIQISNVYAPNGKVGQSYYGYIGWTSQNISLTTDLTAIIDRVGNNNYPYPYLPNGLTFSPNCLAGAPGSSCVFSGLKSNSSGQGQIFLGGTPNQAGTYNFTVQIQDNQGHTSGLKTITITVDP